jgi:hypothetical protein
VDAHSAARHVPRRARSRGRIFVAVDHLRRADRLSTVNEQRYLDIDDGLRAELPNPSFYADGNTLGAITSFKTYTCAHMLERLQPLCEILGLRPTSGVKGRLTQVPHSDVMQPL